MARRSGNVLVMECGCTAGSINIGNATVEVSEDQFQCHVCGEGLECPFHSSLDSLTQGLGWVRLMVDRNWKIKKWSLDVLRCCQLVSKKLTTSIEINSVDQNSIKVCIVQNWRVV